MSGLKDRFRALTTRGFNFSEKTQSELKAYVDWAKEQGIEPEQLFAPASSFDTVSRPSGIKAVFTDVDGVLTTGALPYGESGHAQKVFEVKDGLAIVRCLQAGIAIGIISAGRRADIVQNRADDLGIKLVSVSSTPKEEVLSQFCQQLGIEPGEVAYIGDDLPDAGAMKLAGYPVCPSNAVPQIKKLCKLVLQSKGGEGAVRECLEFLFPQLFEV